VLQSISDQLTSELEGLGQQRRLRVCPEVAGVSRVDPTVDGEPLTSFCSNDYLGLASHPQLALAAAEAAALSGFGASASRLVSGSLPDHRQLELALASLLGLPEALVFSTGYQANLGVISALAGPSDLLVADRAVHASLVDACRLSRAKLAFYPHLRIDKAEEHLERLGPKARRRFVVTESVFSMDGDRAPLLQLAAVAKNHDAALVVDEAHAIGNLGPLGAGLCAKDRIVPDVLVGTLGKAFGAAGAFVAGSALVCQYLVNRARPFIFTTALPPPVAAAAIRALGILRSPEGESLRARLAANVETFRARVGLPPDPLASPIIPIILGSDAAAIRAAEHLRAHGLFVQPIRPPAVREGTSRLRLTFSALHTAEHLCSLAEAILSLPAPNPPQTVQFAGQPRTLSTPALPHRVPRLPGLFVAGTDTGVGKTAVALGLLHLLARRGTPSVPFKPVETGASPHPRDAAALHAACQRPDLPMSLVCPIPLRQPVAPAAAAAEEGVDLSLPVLLRHFDAVQSVGAPVVVESAGGLLTPYAPSLTSADLAAAFKLPVLLVARNSLGTVNHTALAIAEIRRRGLPFLGTVLVNLTGLPSPDQPSNPNLIAGLTGIRPLGVLPFVEPPSPTLLARQLEAAVDLRAIWEAVST
jgi:8-amino-7-oxononanoate synthase